MIRDARRMFSIRDVLGINSRVNPVMCPFKEHIHTNYTPSLNIYWKEGVEKFVCMGNCQKHGDVIDMVGYLEIPGYNDKDPEHIRRAIKHLSGEHEYKVNVPPARTKLPHNRYMEYLPPSEDVRTYAIGRGLLEETLEKFNIGSSGSSMALPYFHNRVLMGIKFRNITSSRHRYWSEKGSVHGIYNYDGVLYSSGPILFLKSEITTALAVQEGFIACGLTAGEGQNIDRYDEAFLFSDKTVYVADNDPDPRVRELVMRKAEERAIKIKAIVRTPPEKYKDWDDWLLADRDECLSVTKRWLNE